MHVCDTISQKNLFVSVVIPTYNRDELLCDTIRQVLSQNYPSFELIVVDQSETHEPSTQAFLDALPRDQAHVIRVTSPNLPNARNIGAESAEGDIVIYIDDDVSLQPNFLTAHAKCFTEDAADAVAGSITESGELLLHEITLTGRWRRQHPIGGASFQYAHGGNMSVRRELLGKVGGFDVGYVGNALNEDADFSFRLRRLGYRIVYCPEAKLIHLRSEHGGCRSRNPLQGVYERMYNVMRFTRKHMPLCVPLVFVTHILIACKKVLQLSRRPAKDFVWLASGLRQGYLSCGAHLQNRGRMGGIR